MYIGTLYQMFIPTLRRGAMGPNELFEQNTLNLQIFQPRCDHEKSPTRGDFPCYVVLPKLSNIILFDPGHDTSCNASCV